MEDKTAKELLQEIAILLKPVSELSSEIISHADVQYYTEQMYNRLVDLAYEGISFLNELEVDQVITQEWIIRRDKLVEKAQSLILDAPRASEKLEQ